MYGIRGRYDQIRANCARTLVRGGLINVKESLLRWANMPEALEPSDSFGTGVVLQRLEEKVAALLGQEAAVFMSKGVAAQQIALRLWTEDSGRPTVALHPKSHFRIDEKEPLPRLHQIIEIPLGSDFAPFTVADLERMAEVPGAVTVELPLRRAGFRLLSWQDLCAISEWCRSRSVPLHMDGARLWEAAVFYDKPHAEIAALFDSTYVSLYKGLGGLAGCILAGTTDFIAAARVWQTRLGAVLPMSYPMVLAALDGLDRNLPRLPEYCARAKDIADALRKIDGVIIADDTPQVNSFHMFLPGSVARTEAAHADIAERTGIWLSSSFNACQVPDYTMVEIDIGSAASTISTAEVVDGFAAIIAQARTENL